MRTLARLLSRAPLRKTVTSVICLLVISDAILSQSDTQNRVVAEHTKDKKGSAADSRAVENQRRVFATSMVISLATEARSFKDLSLRPRVLARAADALWESDVVTARALFLRAWETAEAADADNSIAKTNNGTASVPAQVVALRKMSGHDLRVEVLGLASRRDRTLAEQFLAKLRAENAREAEEAKNSSSTQNAFSGTESNLKRLLAANKLLAAGDVIAAVEFAAPALTEVSSWSIGFLSDLRTRDSAIADRLFSSLLDQVDLSPFSDANTISGLSSYAFTPGFYIVFWPDGHATWMQPEGTIVTPNLDPALRNRFFQVAAKVLLRPVPPSDQDLTSAGRRGRLKVITRLLPLFDQYMPDTATALRSQLTASEGRNIDATDSQITEGIKSNMPLESNDIENQLGRARSSKERDQLYASAAASLAPTGNKRAREYADAIDESQLRTRIRNYVDVELIKFAIREKSPYEITQLAVTGELSHIQRSWSYAQAARLLLESERDRASEFLQKAVDEADRIEANDPDASFAFIGVANEFLAIDHSRAWEILDKAVKVANATEEFKGDDIQMPKGSMIATKNGTRFIRLPSSDFNFSRVLRVLAQEDLFRSIELAKGFKYEAVRAYATLAIAKAVLEKPNRMVAATN